MKQTQSIREARLPERFDPIWKLMKQNLTTRLYWLTVDERRQWGQANDSDGSFAILLHHV